MVTNQAVANIGSPFNPTIAACGNVVAHAVDSHLWMEKLDSHDCGKATLHHSSAYHRGLFCLIDDDF